MKTTIIISWLMLPLLLSAQSIDRGKNSIAINAGLGPNFLHDTYNFVRFRNAIAQWDEHKFRGYVIEIAFQHKLTKRIRLCTGFANHRWKNFTNKFYIDDGPPVEYLHNGEYFLGSIYLGYAFLINPTNTWKWSLQQFFHAETKLDHPVITNAVNDLKYSSSTRINLAYPISKNIDFNLNVTHKWSMVNQNVYYPNEGYPNIIYLGSGLQCHF